MWRLKEIEGNNIVSFRHFKVVANQNVATLIFGQNMDNENQRANGSGKSSLVEALSFALTGETLRKVKVDEIINDEFEDADVTLTLENDFDDTVLTISRSIHRKGSQEIELHKFNADGEEIETDKTIQPSVADYNRFIFGELGLVKNDIYSNYILCRNKYKSFFDCGDKDKKEIINRFSNGIIVDEAMEAMKADIDEVSARLEVSNNDVARVNGKIDAANEQMNEIYLARQEAAKTKEENIKSLRDKMAEKRGDIDALREKIAESDKRLDLIDEVGNQIEDIESSKDSFEECYNKIVRLFQKNQLGELEDYMSSVEEQAVEISECEKKVSELTEKLDTAKWALSGIRKTHTKASDEYNQYKDECSVSDKEDDVRVDRLKKDIDELGLKSYNLYKVVKDVLHKAEDIGREIVSAQNLLYGAVECPKCHHKFILSTDKTTDDIQAEIDELTARKSELGEKEVALRKEINDIEALSDEKDLEVGRIRKEKDKRNVELQNLYKDVQLASEQLNDCVSRINSIEATIDMTKNKILAANGKIDNMRKRMFDDVYAIIDGKIDAGENYVKNLKETISHYEGIIEQYRINIKDLEQSQSDDIMGVLEESKKAYEKELEEVSEIRDKVSAEFEKLKNQETYFTAFKTHLANMKIDAISAVTNEYLEKIGSDLRVYLEGFKVLKSGNIRDKITVNILRNGIDCGSIDKLSAGEKTRVCLASIIALQQLTNSACENGRGLDLIIADEILDASDFDGLMSYCDAINSLGITAFIITQNAIAENYPYKLLVSKKNGISTIK